MQTVKKCATAKKPATTKTAMTTKTPAKKTKQVVAGGFYRKTGEYVEPFMATVTVGVEFPNRSPNAVAESPLVILVPAGTETGTGVLDGSKSSDPDGDQLTYAWRSLGPLHAELDNPSAQSPTATFLGGYGEYNFELMVTDPDGLMHFDTVKVFWVDP